MEEGEKINYEVVKRNGEEIICALFFLSAQIVHKLQSFIDNEKLMG